MSRKTMSKKSNGSTITTNGGIAVKSRSGTKSRRSKVVAPARDETFIPRATTGFDEDDVLLSGGGSRGFGRCGGRVLSSRIEQTLCDKLARAGVTHSHSPRHFEVHLQDEKIAAYAPMVVLRGRGREGKTVVIEAAGEVHAPTLDKIAAFRRRLGVEFYVIFVAPDEVLDAVAMDVYDEPCSTAHLDALVSRLAD